MADPLADAKRFVRAMQKITFQAQLNRKVAERIIRTWRDDQRQLVPLLEMFLPVRSCWIPTRIDDLRDDLRRRSRRLKSRSADSNRVRYDRPRIFREIVQAVLGQVDHNALARAWR